jgi:NTP pyrophosphatase (non-canonical NTP hydrolase)
MTTNYRARCAELLQAIDDDVFDVADGPRFQAAIDRARADLSQPEPVAPVGVLHVSDFRGLKNVDFQQLVDLPPGKYELFSSPAPVALTDEALLECAAKALAGGLTFDEFRTANVARSLKWHSKGLESWSPSDWLTAVTGELGELASLLKMRNRERDGLPGNKFSPTNHQVADELADVLTYLDLLAATLGVDLGRAAVQKFNEVSERIGFPDRIELAARSADRGMLESQNKIPHHNV